MDPQSPIKTTTHPQQSSPPTIRKKAPLYDRHIFKIDRTRYELTSTSSSSQSTSPYQSSL